MDARSPALPIDERKKRKREEMRRYRRRENQGIKIAPTPYDQLIVRYLLWLGALDQPQADNKRAIGEAYYQALLESAKDAAAKGYI
jgi:hypothetical protein